MSKYAALGEFLSHQKNVTVRLSFGEVEKVLGFKLPSSAYSQRAWWSNNVHNNVMTRIWKKAGFRTEDVDMAAQRVVFRNTQKREPFNLETIERYMQEEKERKANFTKRRQSPAQHPLRGALKGTLRIVGGTDLTKPADPGWSNR